MSKKIWVLAVRKPASFIGPFRRAKQAELVASTMPASRVINIFAKPKGR